jgi:Tfp pilus assembly protein PilZ
LTKFLDGSFRHFADKAVAYSSFITFTLYAAMYVRDPWILIVGWPIWMLVVASFVVSVRLHENGQCIWVYAHACFHIAVAGGQTLVIWGIER